MNDLLLYLAHNAIWGATWLLIGYVLASLWGEGGQHPGDR